MYTFDEKLVSDLHKDAYGFRPNPEFSMLWQLSSDDQKQEIWDDMLAVMIRSMNDEEAAEKAAIEDFEAKVLEASGDRKEGIRKVIQQLNLKSVELLYGGEYVCFQLGLPFSKYTKELDEVVAEMQQA